MKSPWIRFGSFSAPVSAAVILLAFGTGGSTLAAPVAAINPAPAVIPVAVTSQPQLRYRIFVDQGSWDEVKTNQWKIPWVVSVALQQRFIEKLQDSGYFIVEAQESATGQSSDNDANHGTLAPDESSVAPVDEHTDADYIVRSSVIGYSETSVSKKGLNVGDIRLGGDMGQAAATITIRIFDAQTGDLLDAETTTGKAQVKSRKADSALIGGDFNDQDFESAPPGQAIDHALNDAVNKIAARISREPWSALVAAQDDSTGRVIINAGDLAGVQLGQTFDVFRAGQPILDPNSGKTISVGDEVIVGRIRVVRTERYAAYCDVVNGDKFLAKDIIKPISQ